MRVRSLMVLTALLLAALFSLHLRKVDAAGEGWLPISPEELKMTSAPEAPGAPAIYLYRQVDRNDSNRASSEFNYCRIKVLTEEGRTFANVQIPFEKGRYGISNLHARTVHPDGSIIEFSGNALEKTIEKRKGEKFLAKTFTLPDVQPGSIIEYRYHYDFEDNYIFSSRWLLSEELFTRRAVFSLKPYTREAWTVQWMWPAGLPAGTEPPKEGADGIVRMAASNIPAFKEEDFMPPPNELKMRVEFLYHEERPEQDLNKFWQKFGKKANGNVEAFVDKRKAMETAIAQIVAPGDSPDAKLSKIYARTQQIRNLSYEPRRSEQEAKHDNIKTVKNVEELWNNGYGYGDQITWLFLALARAAGFEAYPALVSARSEYFFRKERPDTHQLNANVVLVKIDGKERYFDPGALYTTYGFLPWVETGVVGLKLDKDGGSWIQTELPMSVESQIQRKAELQLTEEGALEGKVTVTYTGLQALSRRQSFRNQDDVEKKKYLEDQLQEAIPASAEIQLTNSPEWKSSAPALVAEYKVKVPGWAASAGKRALIAIGLFSAPEKHVFEHADRTQPIYFSYPYRIDDQIDIHLPTGWQVSSLPKSETVDLKAVTFTLAASDDKNTIHLKRNLTIEMLTLEQKYYSTLRSFYQTVRSKDDQQIVVQPGTAPAGD